MELREFAETILYGNNLTQGKLLQPSCLSDEFPGKEIFAPRYPNRPKGLEFGQGHANKKIEFPNQRDIEKEYQRGIVLHFFANHELLAMELMALALLRFPNAPKKFRMGIAKTILEEQRHMQMYMERMHDFNVTFGEIPVNDFFWKCLSNMSSPMDYVTKLSMTFEQANLDFSYFYMNLMKKIGDTKTAEILKIVFEEEIGHVKHGVVWFDQWRDSSQSQWQCYIRALSLPLTPARAKGIIFCKNARIAAGLSVHYIDELSVFSASKGRPPDIYFFNPCCELEVARGKPGYNPVKSVKHLQEDCASLCLFLAAKDDIVLVPKKPSLSFLQQLKMCGFDLPEWYIYNDNQKIDISEFPQNNFGSLKPWGWSPDVLEFLQPFIPRLINSTHLVNNKFYSKAFSAELTHAIYKEFISYKDIFPAEHTLPIVCNNFDAVVEALNIFLESGCEVVVLKAAFSSAGQNMLRIKSTLVDKEKNWVQNILKEHKAIVVEPWFDRVADFSSQLKIENNKVIYLGDTRLLTDKRGQYMGTLLGKKMDFLSEEIVKFIYSTTGSQNFQSLLKRVSLFVGERLLNEGYEGSFGLDVFIYRDVNSPHGFRIKFISEINPRFTMGRIALEIAKRIVPGAPALWLHLRLKDIEEKYLTKENFINKVTKECPLEVTESFKPQIKRGVLFTNDITQSKNTVTVLIVGQENILYFSRNLIDIDKFATIHLL